MIISKKKLEGYIKLMWDTKEENEALKKQIARLQFENESTERYRNEYKKLSEESKKMIEEYKVQLKIMQELENEYKEYLDKVKRNR